MFFTPLNCVCITYHFPQFNLHNCSNKIRDTLNLTRKWKAVSELPQSCSLAWGQALSWSTYPPVRFLYTREHWACSIMLAVFMTVIDSSIPLTLIPGEKTWTQNWFSSLLVPTPLLHTHSQTCRKVRSFTSPMSFCQKDFPACDFIDLWFDAFLNMSASFYSISLLFFPFLFCQWLPSGPICIPVRLGPRCAVDALNTLPDVLIPA